jgi:Tol biopolymer transport system component
VRPIIPPVISAGTRLGPYDIEAPLGSGGAGEVYRARDTRLGRAVAIKVLNTAGVDAAALRERLQREARAISQLAHPHICTLFDIGVTPDGVSYLVMELIDGETLDQAIARAPLPLPQAIAWGSQIADALGAAHRAGIVHGDLKPGNVMVTRGGVKLLDFGLASERPRVTAAAEPDQVTRTTVIAPVTGVTGTLQYLAPEQIEGQSASERSDIFACGAVLYEMVTGAKAFTGQTPASVIAAILREEPPAVTTVRPDAPAGLERLVQACLAKDPADRWQSAADLARELRWLDTVPREGRRIEASRPAWLMWAAGTAAVLLIAAVLLLAREYLKPPPRDPGAVARTSVLLPDGLQFPAGSTLGGVGRFAVSPDGRRLVFVGVDTSGNQMLWLRPLDALSATPLPGTAGASSPFWSPDSESIAFVAQGQLRAITLPGGEPRVIATSAFNATGTWSGDTILFTPSPVSPISRVPASGGTPRPVTRLDKEAGDVVHRSPSFLPDGRHFLYVAVAARTGGTTPRAVYVGSIDEQDGPARLLLESGSTAKYADGYLVSLRENTLVAQPFDPARLSLSGDPRIIADQVELSGVASATFGFSDTGALVYQTSNGGSQLVWVDRQGRPGDPVGEAGHYGDLELSPDGRQVAVSLLDPTVSTRDVWLVDLARGVRTRLTTDRADDVAPVWSADETRIAFASNRTGHFELYQKAASGIGADERIGGADGEGYPSTWAPDGGLLFWTFVGRELGVLRMVGQTPAETWIGGASQATVSPDGRWALYVSGETGRPEVYLTSYPAHDWRTQVSIGGGLWPRWRADAREVYYTGRDNKLMAAALAMRGARLAVGATNPLFDVRPVGRGLFYAPSADGEKFLINTLHDASAAATLTFVQNWRVSLQP